MVPAPAGRPSSIGLTSGATTPVTEREAVTDSYTDG
jgi:hypothetical protein